MVDQKSQKEKKSRLEARIPENQKQLLLSAANITGQSLTDFVLGAATESAREIMEKHHILELSARDCETFVSALLEDEEPSGRLKQAARDSADFME